MVWGTEQRMFAVAERISFTTGITSCEIMFPALALALGCAHISARRHPSAHSTCYNTVFKEQ